ncbi:MAG: hypothetical protein Q9193_002701 [Seirophora villosa]
MTSNPPSPSSSTSPPAPSPFLSTFIGFPRLIDLANYKPSLHSTIPDLMVTVLHNHDLAHGKETLAAFLDFKNLDFNFARRQLEGEEKGLYFHIQRDRQMVLMTELSLQDDMFINLIDPSGVWRVVTADAEEVGLMPWREQLAYRAQVMGFVRNVLGKKLWRGFSPEASIDVAVTIAI